jgi:hypothetical protein
MKKLFVLTVIFALVLAGCGDGAGDNTGNNNNGGNTGTTTLQIKNESTLEIDQVVFRGVLFSTKENADVIGTWTGKCITNNNLTLRLDIADNAWTAVTQGDSFYNGWTGQGQWIRKGNVLTFNINGNGVINNGTATLSEDTLTGNFYFSNIGETRTFGLTSNNLDKSIKPGTSATKNVEAGSGYIFFRVNSTEYRTNELVVVENKEKASFTFLNNTLVVDVNDPSNTVALGGSKITLKQGDTVIEQQGEYSFGTVRIDTTREITFTIENMGGANLTLETVNGNKINLADNTSGFFSVNLQPLSSTIAPGNNTTFTVRFAPMTLGNNIAATVQIKTNNQDFVFRVIGNCSNTYQIGDTGPGGGMIFYAEGGQFKECSGELGTNNWNDGKTSAQNYNGGGFSNWYFPDRGDVDLMYQNLHRNGLGGFLSSGYWSSAEYNSTSAYYLSFYSGSWTSTGKSNSYRVRAVRSFSLN